MDRYISTKRHENTKRATKTTDTPRKPLPTHNRTPLKARQYKELNEIQQEAQKVSTLTQEIYNCNSNDSGICSTKSLSPPGKLGDYMNCPADKENDTSLIIPGNSEKKTDSASHKKNLTTALRKTIPAAPVSIVKVVTDNPVEKPLPNNSSIWTRIGKDLESPSAAVRMRALKATKDPVKYGYTQFDVPSAEQSLHIPYVEPPSLLEIMRNIIVYVEVRSGEDNRSAGVRKVIEALGARVNLTFLKDTTHVVFKDGLLSTYKKAKQMDIPVVSILWIEACKTQRRICDPKDYPISNIDRYENPELYSKMKRIKSMQPDSECNKRVRNKGGGGGGGGTPNHIATPTQKTELIKKNSTLIHDSTPTSSINQKTMPISQYFKKLNNESHNESPATQFLNKIHAETVRSDADMEISKTPQQQHVKKMLNFTEQGQGGDSKHDNNTIKVIISKKQTTDTGWIEVDTATNCLETMAISNAASNKLRKSRRRTINTPKNMTLEQVDNSTVTQTPTERKDVTSKTKEKKTETNKKLATSRRYTIYSVQTMGDSEIKENTNKAKSPVNEKLAKRRRTLFTKEIKTVANKEEKDAETQQVIKAETANVIKGNKKMDVKSRRRTLNSIQPMDESDVKLQTEQEKETNTKTPTNAMKTSKEANKSNGSTPKKPPNQLETINEEVPERSKTTRRRTLYTPQDMLLEVEPLKIATLTPISKVMKGLGICTTPANICKIASNLSGTKRLEKNSHQQQQSSQSSGSTSSKTLTPTNQVTQTDVIVDEATSNCTTPLVFSSKRPPTTNRRRTLFDVSMDIITQRLQCINRTASSRRSMAMDSNNHASTPTGDNTIFKNNSNNNNAEEDDDDKTEEISVEGATPSTTTLNKDETKRKRKLFVPNNDLLTMTPPPEAATSTTTPLRSTSSIVSVATQASRPSLLHNAAEPSSMNCNNGNGVTETLTNPRRSTLDFESQREKTTSDTNNNNKKNGDNGGKVAKRALPVLVYTNMHKEEVNVIREAVSKLGGFRLNCIVSDESSHLVTLDSRRTLNLLRALIRGLWIVRYDWVLESMKAGRWLAEEPFELQNFSRAIEICRSERQAFGSSYKSELFLNFGPFYVATRCGPISRNNARELITLCGGKLVGSRQKARYIIGEKKGCPTEPDDKLCISSYWILDSITEMQILKLDKYICKATAPLAAAGGAGPKKPPLQ